MRRNRREPIGVEVLSNTAHKEFSASLESSTAVEEGCRSSRLRRVNLSSSTQCDSSIREMVVICEIMSCFVISR